VLGTLARSFNLSARCSRRISAAARATFLRRLLHEVIFGEAGLRRQRPAEERGQQRVRRSAYAAMAALTIALVAAVDRELFQQP
jgi:type VI secretion system protein ImpL